MTTLEMAAELMALSRIFERTSSSMADRLGLRADEQLLIRMASRYEWIGMKRLARMMLLDELTLGRLVRRLEASGHIRATRRSGASTGPRICLTPLGSEVAASDAAPVEVCLRRVMRRSTDDAVASARRLVLAVTTALEREVGDPPRRPRRRARVSRNERGD